MSGECDKCSEHAVDCECDEEDLGDIFDAGGKNPHPDGWVIPGVIEELMGPSIKDMDLPTDAQQDCMLRVMLI